VRDGLLGVIQKSYNSLQANTDTDELNSTYGISFDFGNASGGVFDLSFARFAGSAQRDREALEDFLFKAPPNQAPSGFVTGLIAKLDEFGTQPVEEIAAEALPGFFVELRA